MLETVSATVTAITRADTTVVEARGQVVGESSERRIVAYPSLMGSLAVGDTVLLNKTATSLSLGTGGYDFVVANLSHTEPQTFGNPDGAEHIVKLRYTPHQHAVSAVEMRPELATFWEDARHLHDTPVVVCELHSQVAAVCAGVKATRPDACIVYVYTDTAALPIAFSRLVWQLKEVGLLDATITAGQAFGGDYEAVSVASALIAAQGVANAEVIIVGQGPGNAGTGTRYGWSGIEQGSHLALARNLGGRPIAVLRVSNGDERGRHQGLSHHSKTVLGQLSGPVNLAIPAEPFAQRYAEDIDSLCEPTEHVKCFAVSEPGLSLLDECQINVTTMGRTIEQDRAFFAFASAAGAVAAKH